MIRSMVPADRAFVANSWLRSFEYSDRCGLLPTPDYWAAYTPVVDGLLDDPAVKVHVSCNPGDPSQIFGWLAELEGDDRALLYLYVKHSFRDSAVIQPRLGYLLVEHAGFAKSPFQFVFRSRSWDLFSQRQRLDGDWRPELLRKRVKEKT